MIDKKIDQLKKQIKNYNIIQINANNNVNISIEEDTPKFSTKKLSIIKDNELAEYNASQFIKNIEFKQQIAYQFIIPNKVPKIFISKNKQNGNLITKSKDYPQYQKQSAKKINNSLLLYFDNSKVNQFENYLQDLNNYNYTRSDIDIIKLIGTGGYAKVYESYDKIKDRKCALKCIDKKKLQRINAESYARQEITIQKKFRNKNIVKVYSSFEDSNYLYVIQELCTGGDLFKFLKKQQNQRIQEEQAKRFIKQIIEAIIYMHTQNVIHRDIKLENVLITENEDLKMSDLGFASLCEDNSYRTTFCGTPHYIAPEMIKGQKYKYSVDVWAIGILTYELTTGKPPFIYPTEKLTYQNIILNNKNYEDYMSEDLQDFISKLLTTDPINRSNLNEALEHKWLKDQ